MAASHLLKIILAVLLISCLNLLGACKNKAIPPPNFETKDDTHHEGNLCDSIECDVHHFEYISCQWLFPYVKDQVLQYDSQGTLINFTAGMIRSDSLIDPGSNGIQCGWSGAIGECTGSHIYYWNEISARVESDSALHSIVYKITRCDRFNIRYEGPFGGIGRSFTLNNMISSVVIDSIEYFNVFLGKPTNDGYGSWYYSQEKGLVNFKDQGHRLWTLVN